MHTQQHCCIAGASGRPRCSFPSRMCCSDSAMQLRSPHPARRCVRVGDDLAGAAGIHCVGHDAWGVWAPIRGRTYGLMRASQDQHTS